MAKTSQRQEHQSQRPSTPIRDWVPECQRSLSLRNRQRVRRLDLRLLRRIVQSLLQERWPECSYDLAFYVVAEPEMIRLNEDFLRHNGATDVITFDYAEEVGQASCRATSGANIRTTGGGRDVCAVLIHGEIFICVDEALCQARRFRTTWQSELVRYAVHGVLHLLGYDDLNVRARRKMKAAENEIVRQLARQFSFRSLDATSAVNRT